VETVAGCITIFNVRSWPALSTTPRSRGGQPVASAVIDIAQRQFVTRSAPVRCLDLAREAGLLVAYLDHGREHGVRGIRNDPHQAGLIHLRQRQIHAETAIRIVRIIESRSI